MTDTIHTDVLKQFNKCNQKMGYIKRGEKILFRLRLRCLSTQLLLVFHIV